MEYLDTKLVRDAKKTPPYITEKNHLKQFFRYLKILSPKPFLVFSRFPTLADFRLIFAYFSSRAKPVRPDTLYSYFMVFRKQLAQFDLFLPLIPQHQGFLDRFDGYKANFTLPTKVTANLGLTTLVDVVRTTDLNILDNLKKACAAVTGYFSLVRVGNIADPRPLRILRFSHLTFYPTPIAPQMCLLCIPALKQKEKNCFVAFYKNGSDV